MSLCISISRMHHLTNDPIMFTKLPAPKSPNIRFFFFFLKNQKIIENKDCGVCQSNRKNNNRNPGDPALERFNINISVIFLSHILLSLFTFKIPTK